jgi:hypothetical protein
MTETYFTTTEIAKLARLINSFGIIGGQLIHRHKPDQCQHAHINLTHLKRDNKELLERIHSLARKSNDESALRLTEDLERVPPDAAHALALARRCLFASGFLGHLIAASQQPDIQPSTPQLDRRLH